MSRGGGGRTDDPARNGAIPEISNDKGNDRSCGDDDKDLGHDGKAGDEHHEPRAPREVDVLGLAEFLDMLHGSLELGGAETFLGSGILNGFGLDRHFGCGHFVGAETVRVWEKYRMRYEGSGRGEERSCFACDRQLAKIYA